MKRDRIKLSKRLQEIANKVDENSMVSDIGSDHAFIPIYLIKNEITSNILITDIKIGPINVSKRNVTRFGVKGDIQYKQCDGLELLDDSELDNVIIAGMGGELIQQILGKSIDKAKKVRKLILQPMKSHEILRKWLWENGFTIEEETLIKDKNWLYNIMTVKYNGEIEKYERFELYTGKYFKDKIDTLVNEYFRKHIKEFNKLIAGFNNSKYNRIKDVEDLKILISDLSNFYDQRSK